MNRGYFKVTKELIDEPIWHEVAPVINANFREVERKEVANGLIEFHGYSDLFTITPIEGASHREDRQEAAAKGQGGQESATQEGTSQKVTYQDWLRTQYFASADN